MKTVKIYKVNSSKGFMADETGSGFSLYPWGDNTSYYEGSDDGGKNYELPAGYEVAEGNDDQLHIYDKNETVCELLNHSSGRPQLAGSDNHAMPVLARKP